MAEEFRRFLWFLVAIEPNSAFYFGGGVLSYSPIFIFILYTLFYFLTPYQSKSSLSFFVSCDPVSSYRFALCFAVAKLISSSPMFHFQVFETNSYVWSESAYCYLSRLLYSTWAENTWTLQRMHTGCKPVFWIEKSLYREKNGEYFLVNTPAKSIYFHTTFFAFSEQW